MGSLKDTSPRQLVQLAIAEGATAPAGYGNAIIFSTTTNSVMFWDGVKWTVGATANVVNVSSNLSNVSSSLSSVSSNLSSVSGTVSSLSSSLLNGYTQASLSTDPAAPSAGFGIYFTRDIANRPTPKFAGGGDFDYPLQGHIGFSNVRMWRGGATAGSSATFASTIGSMPYTGASPTAPTIPTLASTNLLTQMVRSTISTGATAGGIAYIRGNQLQVWRGNAAGRGGFNVVGRIALSGTLQTGLRAFCGLVDVAANPTNIDPTTTTAPGGVGLAVNANTGNWKLVNNITGTARTSLDLGASFPVNNTDLMEIVLFSPPNGSGIGYRVTNWSTGAQTGGTLTTNIPAATTFMAGSVWVTNNAAAAAQTLDFISFYAETDW